MLQISHWLFAGETPGNNIPNPSNTNSEVVNGLVNLGLPLLIFGFLGITAIYYIRLIQKGRLELKETITWIIWNLFLLFLCVYLIFVYLLTYFGWHAYNLLDVISRYLGISEIGQQWLIFVMLIFLGFLYAKAFHHTIKISKMKQQIDTLARELAILKGRFENTLDVTKEITPTLPNKNE